MEYEHIDLSKFKIRCTYCWAKIPYDSIFCPYCCSRLKKHEPNKLQKQLLDIYKKAVKEREKENN